VTRAALVLAACVLTQAFTARAHANRHTHIVRAGETLASIAQKYYGDPRRESVIVAENGLSGSASVPIVVGLRLSIPSVSYHRVAAGETWPMIAERYYGDGTRAFVITDSNRNARDQPAEGAELLVPYPLRHVSGPSDTLARIAETYYRDADEGARLLRRFNGLTSLRLARDQVILVPLADLVLSEEGRAAVSTAEGSSATSTGAVRTMQDNIDEQLPQLATHNRRGRFVEAVTLGSRLLAYGELTGNQIVSIERELATAYVALGRTDLAVRSFRAALERQPDMQLDSARTSPTVMQAFDQARRSRGSR
jgi:LysM repeat protein